MEPGLGQLLLAMRIVLLTISAASGVWLGWRVRTREAHGLEARTLLYGTLFALGITTVVQPLVPAESARWLSRSIFLGSLALAQAVWCLYWGARTVRVPSRTRRLFDVVCANVMGMLIVVEVGLASWAALRPSPLVFRESVTGRVAALRGAPHQPFFEAKLNSDGFPDDEFFVAGPEDLVVVVLADSFGLGVVPLRYSFVAVAEDAINRDLEDRYDYIALHNFGLPAIGLAEYAHILVTEARPLRPTLVVVCVFVGNDIHEGMSFTKGTKGCYQLQEWLLWRVTERLLSLARLSTEEVERVQQIGASAGMRGKVPLWIEDPAL